MFDIMLFTIVAGSAVLISSITALFNTKDKIATGYAADKKELNEYISDNGFVLSEDIKLNSKYSYEGICIFGSTGSGKSSSFFIPNLLNNDIKGSFIITDPKGELFELTSNFQKNICGRKILKLSPLEPLKSERYNLLTQCKNSIEVLELSQILLNNGCLSIELSTGKKTGGAEWIQMSESLLSAALLYCYDLEYPCNNINFALKLLINLSTDELDSLFNESNNEKVIEQFNVFKMVAGADRTESSIKITLSSNLKLFLDESIKIIDSSSSFNINDFRKEPTALYITYQENKSNYLAPYMAAMFSDFFIKASDSYKSINDLPINFILDEFANIGYISNMSLNASTLRHRKVNISICLQSITQLIKIYGLKDAYSILNNLKTKLIYPGISDIETLNYISDLCGEKQVKIDKNNVKIKIFEGYQIRCLDNEEVIILSSNKNPVISKQKRYYKNKSFSNLKINTGYVPQNLIQYSRETAEKEIKELLIKVLTNKKEGLKDAKEELFR